MTNSKSVALAYQLYAFKLNSFKGKRDRSVIDLRSDANLDKDLRSSDIKLYF